MDPRNEIATTEAAETPAREAWIKPEIASFEPVKAAEGAGPFVGDGLNNLS